MTRQEFIFTKAFPQRLYRHIVFWVVFYVFSLLTYFHDLLEKTTFVKWAMLESAESFFHVITQMAFCYALLYLLVPFLVKKKYFIFVAGILLLSICTFWIYFAENMFFFKRIHTWAGLPFRPAHIMYWFTMISFFSYFPISAGLVTAISLLKKFYIRQKENQLLTRENANAELQLLKAQVHPHFLFNTLNNIYSFALSKSPEASSLIGKLSDTIYYMITDCNNNSVMLEKELKMLEDYVGLEKVRYGDRLQIQMNITKDYQGRVIAPLLMIPFVENCFKHGSSVMRGRQWINLSIQVYNNLLEFKLSNSKPSGPRPANAKSGIGLLNVKKRLALLYPEKHYLNISSSEDAYDVHMEIELQKK